MVLLSDNNNKMHSSSKETGSPGDAKQKTKRGKEQTNNPQTLTKDTRKMPKAK